MFVLVKAQQIADEYINKSVYLQYNRSNLNTRISIAQGSGSQSAATVQRQISKEAWSGQFSCLTASFVFETIASVLKINSEKEGGRGIRVSVS